MPNDNDEKSDGLEIISIGKLYTGPWEKKYWSSSRGKDRYPYPVEFKAIRTQNGITYRMEIFEGLKGPRFTISSTDGLSCSGQTPDIAWASFQKRSCSRMKFWHGKRFSCKIDGMEFFGFKNAFVQRLLRELVAKVAGVAELMLPSGFCTDASETKDPIQLTDTLPYLEKPWVTRKRSKRTSKSMKDLKRVRHLNMEDDADADASGCKKSCQVKCSGQYSIIPAWNKKNEFITYARAKMRSADLETVIEEDELLVSVREELHSDSFHTSDHLKTDDCLPQEGRHPINSGNSTIIKEDRNLPKDQEPLDRSKVLAGNQLKSSVTEDEDEKRICPETIRFGELCVPDTLDQSPEDLCKLEDVIATDTAISEALATESESHREDEIGTSISNPCSEEGDLDSVGQQIAKSMMTVLLPRALPLLKTFSRKKKKNIKPSEMSTPTTMTENKKIETVASPVRELEKNPDVDKNKKAEICVRNHEDYSHTKSIVPDSFDDSESGCLVSNKLHLLPDDTVDNQTLVCPESCGRDTFFDAEAENSVLNIEKNASKTIIPCTTELVLIEGHHGSDNFMHKSSLTFLNEEDTFSNLGGHSLCVEKEPAHGDTKPLADYMEDILYPVDSCIDQDLAEFDIPASYPLIQRLSCSSEMKQKKEVKDNSNADNNLNPEHESGLHNVLKLVACYVHPMPISAVVLRLAGNDIYVCVLCGSPEQEDRILFVYSTPITGEKRGCPSFVGHASINLPKSEDAFGNKIALDCSAIQFTPDGQSLVLLNSIKVPCCRDGNMNCPCQLCTSDCIEKNAVKIVHVKFGYISVVSKLKTAQVIRCILVCEPNHLVAAEDCGNLYLWVMNSRWSAHIEECHLPLPDNMPSCLVELKKIPQSPVLIIGHNGFGEFSIWNIEKRILVSRFSAPNTSISKCVPICSFEWQRKGCFRTEYNQEELINEALDATKMRFLGRDSQLRQPIDSEDGAIWLLVSTVSYAELEDTYQSDGWQMNSVGCWRLALLVEGMVIMGSPLDLRAAAAGSSVGHGVIGRSDGLVYIWELSTGIKVGNLHHFKGSGVSCIATDSSNAGGLAIASDGGHLLVYIHP